jgi:hypothetical protein
MSRFTNPQNEPDSDADIDRRQDYRDEQRRERLVGEQMNCEHRKVVDGRCRICGKMMDKTKE